MLFIGLLFASSLHELKLSHLDLEDMLLNSARIQTTCFALHALRTFYVCEGRYLHQHTQYLSLLATFCFCCSWRTHWNHYDFGLIWCIGWYWLLIFQCVISHDPLCLGANVRWYALGWNPQCLHSLTSSLEICSQHSSFSNHCHSQCH